MKTNQNEIEEKTMEWVGKWEQLFKMRLRCWLIIGLGIGFFLGLAVARILDVAEFGAPKLNSVEVPVLWTNGNGTAGIVFDPKPRDEQ